MKIPTICMEPLAERYRRLVGYRPWREFELKRMHENLEQSGGIHRAVKLDRLHRQTGRTTRGLLAYLELYICTPTHGARTMWVQSPFGSHASAMLVHRCGDILELLGEFNFRIEVGAGYTDHNVNQLPSLLYTEDGVSHAWNTAPVVTCLECLGLM